VRAPVAVLVAGLALAVGVPTAWAATSPGPAAGPPVASVLASPASPVPAVAAPAVTARPAAPSAVAPGVPPVRLQLAGVDAPLDPVGVDPAGAMALPEDVDRVGWYRFGPAPGADEGTAVLAGHVDDADQGLGALAPLRGVEAGAEVQVTDASGAVTRWRVVSRELIEKRAVPLAALFQRTGPPRLVLLTCGGEFLPELRSYADNVVVVAEPAP
jgi:hypothetical protein